MIKKIGLTKCIEKDIQIAKKVRICKELNIKKEFLEVNKIHNIMVTSTIINEKISNYNNEKILGINLDIEVKIVYSSKKDGKLKVIKRNIFEIINIEVNKSIENEQIIKSNIYMEQVKTSLETTGIISLSLFIIATISIMELEDLNFIASFNTLEENIYSFNKNLQYLKQESFFIDNKIQDIDFKDKRKVFINDGNLYEILENKLKKIEIEGANYIYINQVSRKEILLTALEENIFNLYIYNERNIEIIAKNISYFMKPIYLENNKLVLYLRKNKERIYLVEKDIGNNDFSQERILMDMHHVPEKIKVNNDKLFFIVENHYEREIISYSISSLSYESIFIPMKFGKVEDFKVSDCGKLLVLLVSSTVNIDSNYSVNNNGDNSVPSDNLSNNILLYNIETKVFKEITKNISKIKISSFVLDNSKSFLYLSDDSLCGFNIYKINLNTLEKRELLELNAKNIEFFNF